jgi:hypothetical protein
MIHPARLSIELIMWLMAETKGRGCFVAFHMTIA